MKLALCGNAPQGMLFSDLSVFICVHLWKKICLNHFCTDLESVIDFTRAGSQRIHDSAQNSSGGYREDQFFLIFHCISDKLLVAHIRDSSKLSIPPRTR
jgi:hypothetical protein